MKKRKLRKWFKYTLSVLVTIFITIVLTMIFKQEMKLLNDMAHQCDAEKGYMCSYYEIRQYSLGK